MNVTLRRIPRISHALHFSSTASKVVRRGDHPFGTREYLLVSSGHKIAGLRAHRNIIFGAEVAGQPKSLFDESDQLLENFDKNNLDLCQPLLVEALNDLAHTGQGEQIQAVSPLYGLCAYVRQCLDEKVESKALMKLKEKNSASFDACKIIATNTPMSTSDGPWLDAQVGWEMLAREFIKQGYSLDCNFYMSINDDNASDDRDKRRESTTAELIGLEYLVDTRPAYLKSSGGIMARYYFV